MMAIHSRGRFVQGIGNHPNLSRAHEAEFRFNNNVFPRKNQAARQAYSFASYQTDQLAHRYILRYLQSEAYSPSRRRELSACMLLNVT